MPLQKLVCPGLIGKMSYLVYGSHLCVTGSTALRYIHAKGAGSYLSVSGGSHRTEEPQYGMSACETEKEKHGQKSTQCLQTIIFEDPAKSRLKQVFRKVSLSVSRI